MKMNFKKVLGSIFLFSILLTSCNEDDDVQPISSKTFRVTIENVFEAKDYFANGSTGFIQPGLSESFSFNAGIGHYLSFATMFVQSNDLFYAPGENGIALYDANGNALTGDVTEMINLWDAGTEVNEAPGIGANQPPRQSGPNSGTTENGMVLDIVNVNDGFTYPAVEEVIKVTLAHDGGTMFTVTIENVSASASFTTPLAPGVWVINENGQTPLFSEGQASSTGLERIAEDGDNSMLDASLSSNSGFISPFAPGAYAINSPIFIPGDPSSAKLESLAEDGNPSGFANVFTTPIGGNSPAPIFPGESFSYDFNAEEGDVLSFATMLGNSNDWFAGANGIELFTNGTAISGNITNLIRLYDAGTEIDQYAGAGSDQPARQNGANSGADENGVVETVTNPSSNVPTISDMVKVTIINM
ncbi:spondin domain-containing protein [Maribacter luteus]|uniref:spondin domain-containing protein n=1 Tax=Maribacter luteus TaxID=2594478 RepID=UPI002491B304|nr:spondin domain-containing protein [Maribacter luteus]